MHDCMPFPLLPGTEASLLPGSPADCFPIQRRHAEALWSVVCMSVYFRNVKYKYDVYLKIAT